MRYPYPYPPQAVMTLGWVGPFRYRHLCVTPACLASWVNQGYNAVDVAEYLNTSRDVADHPNNALDLRIQNVGQYRCASSPWGWLASTSPVPPQTRRMGKRSVRIGLSCAALLPGTHWRVP